MEDGFLTDQERKDLQERIDKERQGWQCVTKALNEFEGEGLIRKYLHHEGSFCAVGAALKIAKVTDVTNIGCFSTQGKVDPLYREFEKRFGIVAEEVYNVNDDFMGPSTMRLKFMREYARLRSEGKSFVSARDLAYAYMKEPSR